MPSHSLDAAAAAAGRSAAPVPPLLSGRPPIALLVDYDGTIATTDVSDKILQRFVGKRYTDDDAAYSSGLVGSRGLYSSQVKLLPGDPGEIVALAEAQAHDPDFAPFATRAIELGLPVEVVSDGFGFFIEPALRHLGVPPIPVITASTTFDGELARMSFPNGHPHCFVCGTCKRQRVLAHQAGGRSVVFIGDGASDRYAAAYSDLVFAKRDLANMCSAEGWPFTVWQDFSGLRQWLEQTVVAWRDNPGSLRRPKARPFICGPEVWGPDIDNPPPSLRR
jgi:2-hydroxy-3-keto-5-methylthiopentenyl-1-phosphate phosphatase